MISMTSGSGMFTNLELIPLSIEIIKCHKIGKYVIKRHKMEKSAIKSHKIYSNSSKKS
jgi:hypothetical protein